MNAHIGINYDESKKNGKYEYVEIRLTGGKKTQIKKFKTGNPCQDYINAVQWMSTQDNIGMTFSSSSVDHFVMDNDNYGFAENEVIGDYLIYSENGFNKNTYKPKDWDVVKLEEGTKNERTIHIQRNGKFVIREKKNEYGALCFEIIAPEGTTELRFDTLDYAKNVIPRLQKKTVYCHV